jgi:hypothetical protein
LQQRNAIRSALRDGSYEFGGYRGQPVPKKSDARINDLAAWRPISIANIADRVVQRAILETIWTDIRHRIFTPGSFGSIPKYQSARYKRPVKAAKELGRNAVRKAAARICELRNRGFNWVFETDIENFFLFR